mgnify:CR=1 FL=1
MKKVKRGKKDEQKLKKLCHFYPVIKSLCNSLPDRRLQIFSKLSTYSINMLCECVLNILLNPTLTTSKMREELKEKLGSKKELIRQLVLDNMSVKNRRSLCCLLYSDICSMLQYIILPLETEIENRKRSVFKMKGKGKKQQSSR